MDTTSPESTTNLGVLSAEIRSDELEFGGGLGYEFVPKIIPKDPMVKLDASFFYNF
ncbi:MAG: hypothetical protein KAX49_20540 [Halanaerobiales bacterium]|nr:hypothetical protein [Halanaerobiales bacterium]